jgi:tetratricopeptide (TPR) repeat protein
MFLKGQYYIDKNDFTNAEIWLRKTAERQPDYVWTYISLGYIKQFSDIDAAQKYFERAIKINKDNFIANNNLGFINTLNANFKTANELLENAYSISPRLLTGLNLADTYRYLGEVDLSIAYREIARDAIVDLEQERERFINDGSWIYNYMPLKSGDRETIAYYVTVNTKKQKEAFVYYGLGIDYAIAGKFQAAEDAFNSAMQLDKERYYRDYFRNSIESIIYFCDLDEKSRQWLESQRDKLEAQ